MTPAGIEPATFRFAAQHLNHCATAVPTGYERTLVTCEDSRNLWSEQSPKESDVTRCCNNTIFLLKMTIIVLETRRGV